MTDSAPEQTAIGAAQRLTQALDGMREQLAAVQKRQRRDRHVIIGLAVSLTLDVLITVVVAVFAVQAHDASSAAHRNGATLSQLHGSQVAGCVAGNQTRAQEIALWEHLASLSKPSPGETPEQAAAAGKELAGFLAYVRATFAPRDCAALYRLR